MGDENKDVKVKTKVEEMIESIGSESTVADYKDTLKAIFGQVQEGANLKEAVTDLQTQVAKLVEKTVKERGSTEQLTPAKRNSAFFRAAIRRQYDEAIKHGGRIVRDDKEWSAEKDEKWNIGAFQTAEKAALGTVLRGDATTGSYLVPTEYESEVFRLAADASVMMGKVRTVDMAARDVYWPKELTAVSLTWVTDETTAKTETNPTFTQVHLECETCAAWLTVTDELVEDSLINLADFFQMQFSEAWGQEFDKQVLNSNASPFTSMLYDTSCNIRNMAAGKTDYSDIDFEDLIDMENDIVDSVGERGLVGAYFIMHRKVFNALRTLKDDDGNYIYQKPADGVPATIWNYPYILSDQMPSSTAADAPFLILGNPKYWVHGNRVGMKFQTYNNTIRNVDYDQIFYKFRIRQAFVGGIPEAFAVLETAAS